jgi:hypothetical protein
MKTKIPLSIMISLALLIVFSQVASASLGAWEYRGVGIIKGSSYGYTGKMVRKLSSVLWAGDIVSYTDYPPVVISLGWDWFTTKETCNGNFIQQTQKGGTLVSGTQIATGTYMNTKTCSGNRVGWSLGKHRLIGDTTKTLDWSKGELLP